MKLSSDADILGLIIDIPENKELGIYVKHLYDDQWDYEVEIDRELGDDTLMHDAVGSEVDISGIVGEEFVEVEGVDVRDTATSSHGQGLDGLGKQKEEFAEVECNLSEQVLRILCDSDSDEGVSGPVNVFEERNLKKEGFKFVTGMVFNSSREFKWAVEYHEALRQKDVKFKKNEAMRKSSILAKKKALKQIDGQDSEQFKLLNDYCEELMRSNPGTTVKMKLDSEFIVNGRPRFVRLYICFGACKEGFIRGGRPIIGLDGRWMPPERDKPVQTMCEKIRTYLMTRMQKNRDKMRNYSSMVYPKILKLIEEGKDKCAIFSAYKAVDDIYKVDDDNFKPFKADLSNRECSCRRWDLTGIPCSHAIAAIRKKGVLPELYIHHCYSVEQYLRAYGPAILPIRAEELWHKTDLPPPLPPKYKAQPGRQKKREKLIQLLKNLIRQSLERKQPHSHVPQQPVSHQVEENHEVQGQFEDVVVETQVPDFVLNEMKGMSSQPSQATGGDNAISTVSNFISTATTAAAANEPTSARKKYLTIGGIKYTYSEAYLIRK
nr:uncharacterized protein LOC109172155 [Ipomoea batatas]